MELKITRLENNLPKMLGAFIDGHFEPHRLPDTPATRYLQQYNNFVAYQIVDRDGRKTKVPINPHTGGNASVSDRSTWGTFEQASAFAEQHKRSGVGFVLTPDTKLIGYDFDHCIRDDGSLDPWLQAILSLSETFCQRSPSGRGLRLFALGHIDKPLIDHKAGIEVYSSNRYLTITDDHWPGSPDEIREAPNLLAAVQARVREFQKARVKSAQSVAARIAKTDFRGDVFRAINDAALEHLSLWVPELFPFARETDQGYRVPSHDLDRDLQEDVSFAKNGIIDFGLHDQGDAKDGCRTAIDIVIEHAHRIDLFMEDSGAEPGSDEEKKINGRNAFRAAKWLGERLGRDVPTAAISYPDPNIVLQALNDRFSVVTDGNKVRVLYFDEISIGGRKRLVPESMQFIEFERKFQNKHIVIEELEESTSSRRGTQSRTKTTRFQIGKWWLNHPERKEYEGLVLEPNGPKECNGKLNLWRGFAVEPAKGKWPLIRYLIEELLAGGNKEYATYILKWLAWAVQYPNRPAEAALVLKGEKGTGKSTLNKIMLTIFGQHGLSISNYNHLIGNFNSHLRDACFVALEEAIWAGQKASEGVLKSLITDGTVTIEQKGRDVITVPNMLHFIICSNEKWPVPSGAGERRFAVFQVSNSRKGDTVFWKDLNFEIDNGGVDALLFDLLEMDLTGFHPRDVIHTEAEASIQAEGLSGFDSYLKEILESGVLPGSSSYDPAFCLGADLIADIKATTPTFYLTSQNLANYMKSKGVSTSVRRGTNSRGYEFPSLVKMRSDWEREYPNTKWDLPDLNVWIASDVQAGDEIRKEIREKANLK